MGRILGVVVVGLLCALAIAGCGGAGDIEHSAEPEASAVSILQKFVGTTSYTEGSLSYLSLADHDGDVLGETDLMGRTDAIGRAELLLSPGTYQLQTWQRGCSGSCDELDPPSDECETELEVPASTPLSVRIDVSPGQGCTFAIQTEQRDTNVADPSADGPAEPVPAEAAGLVDEPAASGASIVRCRDMVVEPACGTKPRRTAMMSTDGSPRFE